MILNENQFFHLNFYSSWCSFFTQFTFHFGLISLLTSFLRRNQFLYESNFSAQLLPITFVDLLAAFLLLEPTSSTKIIRNLINNFFNYLRFFIWTGNFNRHYTSTLMARACESNDNKTKGFFFFFLSCTCSWVLSASWMESQVTLPLEVLWCHMRRTARLNRQQLRKV